MPRRLVILCVFISSWSSPLSAQDNKTKPALVLSFRAIKEAVPANTQPAFRLTIRNVGDAAEKILKPRADLQDTYYDLEVTKDGKALNLSRAISDPGPISSTDFMTLEPGQVVTLTFSRFAVSVHDLPSGNYQARIRFWQDPFASHKTAVVSPPAAFTIQK